MQQDIDKRKTALETAIFNHLQGLGFCALDKAGSFKERGKFSTSYHRRRRPH